MSLSGRLSIENADLLAQVRLHSGHPIDRFKYAFRRSEPAHLRALDFKHLDKTLDIAKGYLGMALAGGHRGVNILVYGPPGTGKTQLSRLLTQELQAALYEVACSDSDGDPISANQRLFIASTNLIRDLDEASLRRLDLKIHFSYLTADQVQPLFSAHLRALKLKAPGRIAGKRLHGATDLTPGDFALITRQARFRPFATAGNLATALLAECRLKRAGLTQPIGFVH